MTPMTPQPAGLVDSETAFTLASGQNVAVSINSEWTENNLGIAYTVKTRALCDAGDPILCPNGKPVGTEFIHVADAGQVAELTNAVIVQQLLNAAVGEPIGMNSDNEPLIGWNVAFLSQASVQQAVDLAQQTGPVDLSGI